MFKLSVRFIAVDEKDGKEYLVGKADYRSVIEPGPFTSTVTRMVGGLEDRVPKLGPVRHTIVEPADWKETGERKGQIALAVLKLKTLRDGIKLHPNDLRSETGNTVKQLNELDPSLNLTLDEALKLYREFVDLASEAAFKQSKKDLALSTAREELQRVSSEIKEIRDRIVRENDEDE